MVFKLRGASCILTYRDKLTRCKVPSEEIGGCHSEKNEYPKWNG